MRSVGVIVGLAAGIAVAWLIWASALDTPPPPIREDEPTSASAASAIEQLPPPPAFAERATGLDGTFLAQSLVTPEAAVVEAAADDGRSGLLRGRLAVRQQPWVHPAGVEIRLTRSWLDSVVPTESEPGRQAPARDELSTTTDADGRFVFRIVPPSTELFFLIGHRTEWEDYRKVPKLPRSGQSIDLGDVLLDQRGEIVGSVQLNGLPVAGATVRAVDDPLLDGTSGFEDVTAARTEGAETFRVPGTMRGGPVPAWVARRDRFLPFPETITDTSGRFRLRGVRPGNHNLFVVQSRGGFSLFGRSDGVLVASGRTTDIGALQVKWPREFELFFVDEARKPWVGAQVVVLHATTGFGNVAARTDGAGRVRMQGVDGATGELLFGMPDGGPWLAVPWPDPVERAYLVGFSEVDVVVPRPRDLVVTLVDSGNRPIAGGKVRLYTQESAFRLVDRALPDNMQPRETTPGTHSGRLPCAAVAVASAPGFAPGIAAVMPKSPPLSILMLPLQQATVRVRTLQGEPVADASVRMQVHDNPEQQFAGAQWSALANDRVLLGRTDERGELRVPVWPTWFSFQASHPDFATTANIKMLPVEGQSIDLLLLRGGEVHGTLTIETRPAPAGLRVRARQRPPETSALAKSGFLDERLAVTGELGAFEFRQLAAGLWDLVPELPVVPTVSGPTRLPQAWQQKLIQVEEGQEQHIVLEIQQGALSPIQIHGTVTQNGATVPGALVRVRKLDPPQRERNAKGRRSRHAAPDGGDLNVAGEEAPWLRCTTDMFGDFRFRELAPGADHELRVDVPQGGRLQFVARRIVRSGTIHQQQRFDFALQTSDVRLQCTADGRPLRNRMLRLRQVVSQDVEGARFDVLLDADGQAWIDALPVGSWTIEPLHGGRCEPGSFDVMANTAAVWTFAVFAR